MRSGPHADRTRNHESALERDEVHAARRVGEGWCATHQLLRPHVVEDSGIGIPPDHLPHIFDRFYRVPDPNPEKGLGLGLSFVAAIVKAHGGEIRVHSKPGQGSRFEVTLPVGVTREMEPALSPA